MRPRGGLFVLALVLLIACGSDAWKMKGAPKASPDVQFRTGVEVGYDAWLWHCYEGERVLITQSGSACFGTRAPQVVRGPCGKPLPAEADLAPPERRREIPEGSRWPNSTPESWKIPDVPHDASADSSAVPAPSAAPACVQPPARAIENGACTTNADCVLTDVAADCGACNLDRVYPTLARSLAQRNAACALDASDASRCAPQGCPPRDTYTRAFYRAECRQHRCIAFRYHSGG